MKYIFCLIFSTGLLATTPSDVKICKESKSPLFKNKSHKDILDLEVMVDVKAMHKAANSPNFFGRMNQFPAVLSYLDDINKVNIPAAAIIKGGVRTSCEYVPMKFILSPENPLNKTKTIAELYKDINKKIESSSHQFKGQKQKNNIFAKLGKKIRLVTHCGKSEYDWMSAKTKEQQEQRLLLEFYIYQMLDTTKSTTLKTRLARTTYKDPSGKVLDIAYSFIRESSKDVAKRCELSADLPPNYESYKVDTASKTQLKVLEYIAANSDYGTNSVDVYDDGRRIPVNHNVYKLFSTKNELFYAPYDFDLTALFFDDDYMASHTSSFPYLDQSGDTISALKHINLSTPKMLKIIDDSLLSNRIKGNVLKHLKRTTNTIIQRI